MKVVPESPLRKALFKRSPWMGESDEHSEGGEDEANRQLEASAQLFPREGNRAVFLFD